MLGSEDADGLHSTYRIAVAEFSIKEAGLKEARTIQRILFLVLLGSFALTVILVYTAFVGLWKADGGITR